jgi:methionyl-tRNA formyltransferase
MGSASFAVPALEELVQSSHEILEVVCQPDKPAGRGLKMHACPVAEIARSEGLTLYQPDSVRDGDVVKHFADLYPDIIIVVAYGKILPRELLEVPPFGCINLHASLLPKYRGAAPINWAIVNGETQTGVTTILLNERMDAGDILLTHQVSIDELDDAIEVEERLSLIGAQIMLDTIQAIDDEVIDPMPQNEEDATYAPMLSKNDGLIDWTMSAKEICNRVRGLLPWPVAHTYLDGKLLKIYEAHVSDEPCSAEPGEVLAAQTYLSVATGSGVLYVLEAQIEGKKKMHCEDFLRGHEVPAGTILGE